MLLDIALADAVLIDLEDVVTALGLLPGANDQERVTCAHTPQLEMEPSAAEVHVSPPGRSLDGYE